MCTAMRCLSRTPTGCSRRCSATSRTCRRWAARGSSQASRSAGLHNCRMRISEILAAGTPVFSFEFFPPKTEAGEQNLYKALQELKPLEPSFVSVPYGAGGAPRSATIGDVTRDRDGFDPEAMADST